MNVGTDHDTAAFAVESIRRWWNGIGRAAYPAAGRLLITADAGGSNGYRTRAWKAELAALALETGLHGHRLPLPARHLQVEQDRAPAVLPHHHELARPPAGQPPGHRRVHRRHHHRHRAEGARRTRPRQLPGRRPRHHEQMAGALPLTRHDWHGDWNYTLRPEPPAPPPPPPQPPAGPGTAEWAHPALTGLDPADWDQLITTVHARLGDPPPGRRPPSASPSKPSSPCSRLRFRPHAAPSPSCSPSPPPPSRPPSTASGPCSSRPGYPTQLAGPQLKTLTDLTAYAHTHGLTLTTTHPS